MAKQNNRGQAHLEAIISTVIFIVFIFVMLIIVKPFGSSTPSNNAEILRITLPEYLKADLKKASLNVLESVNKNCFYVPLNFTSHTIAWGGNGSLVQSRDYHGDLYIGGAQGFYYIYYSSEFPDSSMSIAACDKITNYRLGTTEAITSISYSKALTLNTTYWGDYDDARKKVKIPSSSDFGFVIMNDLGKELINAFKTPTTRLNLNVKEAAIPMLYSNGTIENVRLRIFTY